MATINKDDLQTRIDTTEKGEYIFVDYWDPGEVWLSVNVQGGGARCVITKEQALQMIEALQRVVEFSE